MKATITLKPLSLLNATHAASTIRRADLFNLGLLLLAFASVLALLVPARTYPMIDDWAYARSVEGLLNGVFTPHDYTEANAFGHNILALLFVVPFGFSFTTLSAATLFMSGTCLAAFYILLRHLDVRPTPALWGTALLGFNPFYLHLSYSFMTDVTFLAYLLLGCLGYVRGTKGHGEGWLWLGAIATILSLLTRQFGILLVPAALAYLWWSHNWTWRRALAIALLPALVMVAYVLWGRTLPVRLVTMRVEEQQAYAIQHLAQYVTWRAQSLVWSLSVVGLCLLPIVRLPRRPLLALPIFGFFLLFQVITIQSTGGILPQNGNIINNSGLQLFYYYAAPIWPEWVWLLLGIASSLVAALLITACLESLWAWLRSRPWRVREKDPALMLYLLGLMMFGTTLLFATYLFDRYWLPLFPIIIAAALRRLSPSTGVEQPTRRQWQWALLVPLALFSLIAQRDFQEHATARWHGAEQLAAQGIPRQQIDAGYEWAGWYLYDEGAAYLRAERKFIDIPFPGYALLDPVYLVSDIEIPGYAQVDSLSYTSWLNGGQERNVLLLKRE